MAGIPSSAVLWNILKRRVSTAATARACCPPVSLDEEIIQTIMAHTRALAKELSVVGLMNIQYAVQAGIIYVIEVNPRASRTVPFVSKATGVPLAKMATQVIMGKT